MARDPARMTPLEHPAPDRVGHKRPARRAVAWVGLGVRSIHLYYELPGGVWVEENRGGGKTLLEHSEGGAGRWHPEVGTQRGGEVSKGGSYSAVVEDERR